MPRRTSFTPVVRPALRVGVALSPALRVGALSPPFRVGIVLTLALFGLLGLTACGGSGLYNFSRDYTPLKAEREHYQATAQQVAYEDVQRDPNGFTKTEVGWFGIVTAYADLSDGRERLTMSLRAHQPRHLCSSERDSSCRVTVSDRSMGNFVIEVQLSDEQKLGKDRVWIGSLLKVYGTPSGEYDDDGSAILNVKYFRHFPRGTYVTTAQRASMRR